MKLNEIKKVVSQPFGIDVKYFPELTRFRKAKVENILLLYAEKGDDYLFAIKDDNNEFIGMIKAEKITDVHDRETIQIQRTWVNHKYRNKGYMTAMYKTLTNQGFRIFSDVELSPESIAIWKKLEYYGAKMYDTKTHEKIEYDESKLEDENIVFVMEKIFLFDRITPSRVDNDMLEEHRIFIGQDCP